jgi:thiosulfate dehydrogenase
MTYTHRLVCRSYWQGIVACSLVILGILLLPSLAASDNHNMNQVWSIAQGGLLYDNWAAVVGASLPEDTHPAYPAVGKKKGGATWRCKECHGWDYRGADGAYGKGSHYTGITGIRNLVGTDPKVIEKSLRDATHGYTEAMISPQEMGRLALFVSLGQIDMVLYVDRATKKSRGASQRGAAYYQTICAICHGFDGKTLNFKDEKKPEYIGTIARDNPWEFLHKARYGQPGIPMVSMAALPIETLVDLLAYAQTLPAE